MYENIYFLTFECMIMSNITNIDLFAKGGQLMVNNYELSGRIVLSAQQKNRQKLVLSIG